MTRQLKSSPEEAITAVRWRRSQHAGKSWARPLMTAGQVQGILTQQRATRAGRVEIEQARVRLALEGPLSENPDGLLTKLLEAVHGMFGLQWLEKPSLGELTSGQMYVERNGDGSWAGAVTLHCDSREAAAKLAHRLDGAAVEVNGRATVLRALHSASAARGRHGDA